VAVAAHTEACVAERRCKMNWDAEGEQWGWEDERLPFLLGVIVSTAASLVLWGLLSWAGWVVLR